MLDWIGNVLGEAIPSNVSYEDYLKDGVVLCNLINKIAPGSVKKIQTKGSNFQLMENIQRYVVFLYIEIYCYYYVLRGGRVHVLIERVKKKNILKIIIIHMIS